MGHDMKATQVYLLMETTDLLNEPIEPTEAWIRDANGKKYNLSRGLAPIRIPPSAVGIIELRVGASKKRSLTSDHLVSSTTDFFYTIPLGDIEEIEIKNVKHMIMRESELLGLIER